MKNIYGVTCALVLVVGMIVISVACSAAILGTDFSKSTWNAGWGSDFDSTSIDGSFVPSGADGLGVQFNANPPVANAVVEKHYTRAGGDTNQYTVALSQTGYGWDLLTQTQFIGVSTDDGTTWTRVGEKVMDSYDNTTFSATVTVAPTASLWVRNGVVDDGSGASFTGSYILSVSAQFSVVTTSVLGVNFAKNRDWDAAWQSSFDSVSIDGHFDLSTSYPTDKSYIGIYFDSNPPSGDAILEKRFVRASGDTKVYDVELKMTGDAFNLATEPVQSATQYIDYSLDEGATWTRLAQSTAVPYDSMTEYGLVTVPANMPSLYVRYGSVDSGLQRTRESLITGTWATFATRSVLGQNSIKSSWATGWESSFDYTSIDGSFTPRGGWGIDVNFVGNPPVGDAVLEKHFYRADGDTKAYDVSVSQMWMAFSLMVGQSRTHYIDYSFDQGATWTRLISETRVPYAEGDTGGTLTVPASQNSLYVKFGVVDTGDWRNAGSIIENTKVSFMTRSVLGDDFSKSSWATGWESSFDDTGIDGSFTPRDGWGIDVNFVGNPPVGDARLEKHFYRADGDTKAYDVSVSQMWMAFNLMVGQSRTHYVDYSSDQGATWTRLINETRVPYAEGDTRGILTVPAAQNSLYVRFGVVDTGDWRNAGSIIGNTKVNFMTRSVLGVNANNATWPETWQLSYDDVSIDGSFLLAISYPTDQSYIGVQFGGNPPVGDARLEKHFYRAAGDTRQYTLDLAQSAEAFNLAGGWSCTHYVDYSLDEGATWTRLDSKTTVPYNTIVPQGTTTIGPSQQSVWVAFGAVDIGDGRARSSLVDKTNANFYAKSVLGVDFLKNAWVTNWQLDLDANGINGSFSANGSWLGVNLGGIPPGPIDGTLEKRFYRASGDTNAYTVDASQVWQLFNVASPGSRTHYVDYSLDEGATWTRLASKTCTNPPDCYIDQTTGGVISVSASQNSLWVRFGIVDNGDNRPNGSFISSIKADFTVNSVPPGSIKDAKDKADGQPVAFDNAIVSRAFTNDLYIETDNRAMGIRVQKTAHGITDGRVDVQGVMATDANGERYVDAVSVVSDGTGSVAPLGANNKALGGGNYGDVAGGKGQRGVTGGTGVNNIGLLVQTWGRVTYVDANTFTINDGSGTPVKCVTSGGWVNSSWSYGVVTGVASVEKSGPDYIRVIRVNASSDFTVLP